jgi:glutamine---fructose-6-phosphate transaminase (isomerizing)
MTASGEQIGGVVSFYQSEFQEQPQKLAGLAAAYGSDPPIRTALQQFRSAISINGPVVWTGMGASYCSAIAASTLLSGAGWPSYALESSEFLHYATATWPRLGGLILISTSGESAELVQLARLDSVMPKVLLSNNDRSSCWQAAQIRFPILAGSESANATKTYTSSTAACMLMASELVGRPWQRDVERLIAAFSCSLETVVSERQAIEEFTRGSVNIEIIGRGAALGAAIYGSLCVREMTGRRASAHSGGGFRHGPNLDVDDTHLALILALGCAGELGDRLATECLARHGKVILVTDHEPPQSTERLLAVRLEPVPYGWESLTGALVPQALTLAHIEKFGSRYVRVQTTAE